MRHLYFFGICALLLPGVGLAKTDIDFDNSSRQPSSLNDQLKLPAPRGTARVEFFAKSESGSWIPVLPVRTADGGNHYEFAPNTPIDGKLSCTFQGPNPPAGPWSAQALFRNFPDFGGHKSHDAPVPNLATPDGDDLANPLNTGNLAVNTDYAFKWVAPAFATRITQESTWSGSCSGSIVDVIDVKVPGLVQMPPGGAAKGYSLKGETEWHPDNHNVVPAFAAQLAQIAQEWHTACPKSAALLYNDMSLPWGGLFDLNKDWQTPHVGHQFGGNADVSKKWVRKGNRAKLIQIMCKHAVVNSEGDAAKETPHFHLVLLGSTHAEDFAGDFGEKYISCCQSVVPQGCIDLGAGHPEPLPEQTDCP